MSITDKTALSNNVSQNVRITLSSYSSKAVDTAAIDLVSAAKKVGAIVVGAIPMPNFIMSYSVVNKSPHRMTKSKDEMMTVMHRRLIILLEANAKMVDSLSDINIPPGVGVVIKVE